MRRAGLPLSMLLGAALALPGPVLAQRLARRVAPWDPAPATLAWTLARADTAARRDFRWHGTVIGAAALGLAAGLEARAYCGNSENGPRDCTGVTLGVGVLGGVVGGALGHLVGRAIPRR